jgi:hypothetical protein
MYSNLKSEIKHFLFPLLETPTRQQTNRKTDENESKNNFSDFTYTHKFFLRFQIDLKKVDLCLTDRQAKLRLKKTISS